MQRVLLLLVACAALASALPALPGIWNVDFKVGKRNNEFYRAVQYTDEDSPRGGNKTYVQIAVSISRDRTSDLSQSIEIQWVYYWYKRDWADQSSLPGNCISTSRADPQYVGGPTFQIGSLTLPAGQQSINLDLLFPTLEKSGPYYIRIYNCDFNFDLRVEGKMYFRNPYGWLNGEDWPSAALYGLFMVIYILFSIIYGVFLWRNREFSHPFQVMIVALLVISFVFLGIAFIIYLNINARGRVSTGTLVVASIISASRETLIRVLLLCISLGYQMIFPVLGGTCFKATIGIYAGLYWLFYFVVFLLNNVLVNTNDNVSWGGYTFASVIQVIIELVWWFWIFYNTVVVSRILKAAGPNYSEKYRIYNTLFWFMIVLFLYAIISYIVFVIGSYADKLDSWWRNYWYFDFYNEFAFLTVVIILMTSWRPGRDPIKYSYQPIVLGAPASPAPQPPPQATAQGATPGGASPAQQPASYSTL